MNIFYILLFILIYTKITSPLLIDNKSANLDNNNKTYVVQKDDNLWKIAEKYDRNNKEEFIFSIKELNTYLLLFPEKKSSSSRISSL